MAPDGYSWSGSLDDTDIQALYAACQSLRFSGKLELRDGATKAEVTFVGGEPIEIDGGDTQKIALWNRGTFRAIQSIPNLAGELTGQREMEGSLAVTKASQLWAWISEYRLSCEIDLERPGSKAVVTFSNGHAESAQVNGMPELAALARVSSWTDGQFRVRLKPLFVDGVIPAAPPMVESAPPAGRQFDVSRSIPMDLRHKQGVAGAPSFGAARPVTPPELAVAATTTGRPAGESTRENPKQILAAEAVKKKKRHPFDPIEASGPKPKLDPTMVVNKKSRLPLILSIVGIVIAGGLGALYHYHVPPFSPSPQPIVEPAPSGAAVKPSGVAVKPSGVATAPSGAAVAPSGAPVAPSGVATAPSGAAMAPSGAAVKPSGVAVKPETKAETKKERAEDKLVAKARLMMIEGHTHSAIDQLHKAMKVNPKDAGLKTLEQEMLGKLGKADLQLEGKGNIVVDGHKFAAPKRLKVMAGPHVIDAGDGEDEVTLKRGEKRRIKVKH
jgi:hypothetical protein